MNGALGVLGSRYGLQQAADDIGCSYRQAQGFALRGAIKYTVDEATGRIAIDRDSVQAFIARRRARAAAG